MNETRKIILQKIEETPLEEIVNKPTKKNIVGNVFKGLKYIAIDLITWPFRFVGAVLGVSKNSSSSSRRSGASSGAYTHIHTHSSGSSFRDSHRFDPSRAYMERIQEQAYFRMIDGRGDPEHCDCDHDR